MGRKIHIMEWCDPERDIGYCRACGNVKLRRKVRPQTGVVRYACWNSERRWSKNANASAYGWAKGETCERCGFVPVSRAQLDVHHRDGNHHNNQRSNLETLCRNCHALEHHPPPPDNRIEIERPRLDTI